MRLLVGLRGLAAIGFVLVGTMVFDALLNDAAAAEEPVRTWRDATGQYQVEARLVKVAGGSVILKGTDNLERNVPLDKLSAADRAYLKSLEPAATPVPPALPVPRTRAPDPESPPRMPTRPDVPTTPSAPTTPGAPATSNGPDTGPPVKPTPSAPRTWTSGKAPLEASFIDIRMGDPNNPRAAMFGRENASVVLQGADLKETLIPYNQLNEEDRRYLQNRVVLRAASEAEQALLAQPIDAAPVPEAAQALVVVEGTAGDQVHRWLGLVVQTVDGQSLVRTDFKQLGAKEVALEFTGYAISVRNPDGTTRKVSAQFLGYTEHFSQRVFSAAAAELPKPLTEHKIKTGANDTPVILYGVRLNDGSPAGWSLVRCAATTCKRSPEATTFDAVAGEPPRGTAIVVDSSGSYCGLCNFPNGGAILTPEGAETVVLSYQQSSLRPFVGYEGKMSHAYNVHVRKGKEPGVAVLTFIWDDLFQQGTPRLVVACGPPSQEWKNNHRLSTISDFSVGNGELMRVDRPGWAVLECVELTDPAEADLVFSWQVPRPLRSPGNRAMKAAFRYDPAMGNDFPIAVAAAIFDEKTGKYVGQKGVRMETIISFETSSWHLDKK